jgi:general secretion pathway protein A
LVLGHLADAVYQAHFSLSEAPFSIAPDPRYLYMSGQHQEALAHLVYGINSDGGFVLLTGDVGTGKTTVCRCLLEKLPAGCNVAFIYNPKLTVKELLATICAEFGIAVPDGTRSIKVFVDHINRYLLDAHAKGRRSVLIIDEAQNLSIEVLEQLRLLTNLETNERKLLQIILLGQPELQELLARRELRQLAQRIVARYHLRPLSKREIAAYVNHRLTVAGTGRKLFPPATLNKLYGLSGGVPRVINLLCDRALLGAYVQGKDTVDWMTLSNAAHEVFGADRARRSRLAAWGFATVTLVATGAALGFAYRQYGTVPAAPQPAAQTAPKAAEPAVVAKALPELKRADTLDWPEGDAKANSEALANAALFKRWGASFDPAAAAPACRQAEDQGLRCMSERGSMDDLKRLDVPAVLQLSEPHGGVIYALLTGLDGETAALELGSAARKVPLATLEAQWSGVYTLLWRAPPDYHGPLQAGARGAAVDWVRIALAKASGNPVTARKGEVFDQDLATQLKAFQVAEGLVPDGIAGPNTLLRLLARTDPATPLLRAKQTAQAGR